VTVVHATQRISDRVIAHTIERIKDLPRGGSKHGDLR